MVCDLSRESRGNSKAVARLGTRISFAKCMATIKAGFLLLVWFCCLDSSEARVFDFKNEYLASYLRGTASSSVASDGAFGSAGGSGTTFEDKVAYNFSGEIGFLLRFKNMVSFRVGMELLQTKPLVSISGKNASGVELFQLDSEVLILQPLATIEVDLSPTNESRTFLFLGGGLADFTLDNQFTMTSTGTSELGGVTDFSEKATASRISAHAGIGYERLLADTATIALELGYRYLPSPDFKLDKSATTIAQGAVNKSDPLLNSDGSRREVNMSGIFASLGFRFYIDFVK